MKNVVCTLHEAGTVCKACAEPVRVGEILAFYDEDVAGERPVRRAMHLLCPSSEIGEARWT